MERRAFNKLFLSTAIASLSFTRLSKLANAANEVDSPYLFVRPFRPTKFEIDSTKMKAIFGQIPIDLNGSYFRNGPNQHFIPDAAYHWFDGDGMIHCARLSSGEAFYSNKQVKTKN